jgi:RecJ-like exonuclease
MKLAIDFPEIDLKFMRETYKETGLTFVPDAIKNECTEAVYKGTPFEERKTGKWTVYQDCEGKTRIYICPICGDETRRWSAPNYCSNCGSNLEDI